MFTSFNELKLESFEVCFCLENISDINSVNEIKVFIPKIMPLIQMNEPVETSELLNSSIFVNDESNMPKVSKSVATCNYIVAKISNKNSAALKSVQEDVNDYKTNINNILTSIVNYCGSLASGINSNGENSHVDTSALNTIRNSINDLSPDYEWFNKVLNLPTEISYGSKLLCSFINNSSDDVKVVEFLNN